MFGKLLVRFWKTFGTLWVGFWLALRRVLMNFDGKLSGGVWKAFGGLLRDTLRILQVSQTRSNRNESHIS